MIGGLTPEIGVGDTDNGVTSDTPPGRKRSRSVVGSYTGDTLASPPVRGTQDQSHPKTSPKYPSRPPKQSDFLDVF